MSGSNPLQGFLRKSKFQLKFPSGGKWWPTDAIQLNQNGTVDVLAMTASDDVKFRASEASLSGQSTFDLIKSCIPNIKNPEAMPSIDLDVALLAIREATYGDDMELSLPVPKTSLMKKMNIKISELLAKLPDASAWDSELNITNETTGDVLKVSVVPTTAKNVFGLTKSLIKQNQMAVKIAEDPDDDTKLASLDGTIKSLGEIQVSSVVDCIASLSVGDFTTTKREEIDQTIRSMDVEYFNAIQNHLIEQKNRFSFGKVKFKSTPEQLAAGAPEEWEGEITFAHSDFFKNADTTR